MGNPTSNCTVQARLSSLKEKQLQSLSMTPLRLEQPGQLGSINYEKSSSVRALNSPEATEQRSLASSLRGTDDYAKSLDLVGRSSSMDSHRKPTSANAFRDHRRAASGNILTLFKDLEVLQPKGTNSAPRQLDKYAVERLAASIFHTSTTLERSLSMSRVAQKVNLEAGNKHYSGPLPVIERSLCGKQEESLSLQQNSLFKPDDEPRMTEDVGDNQGCSSSQSMHMEDSSNMLISKASSLRRDVHGTMDMMKSEGETDRLTTAIEVPFPFPGDPELHSICSLVFQNAAESTISINRDGIVQYGSFDSETNRILLLECDNHETAAISARDIVKDIQLSPQFVTGEVAEEELTETAILSSPESEGSMTSSDERNIHTISSGRVNETGPEVTCSSNACLTKSFSFENGTGSRLMFKRNRTRSASASGLGAMLLKVVGVPDSGKMVLRKASAAGHEMMSGVDAIRARQYLLQKTAQISVEPAPSQSTFPASATTKCPSPTKDSAKSTCCNIIVIETDSGGDCVELVQHSEDVQDCVRGGVGFVITSECKSQLVEKGSPAQPAEPKGAKLFNNNVGEGIIKALDSYLEGSKKGFGVASTRETESIDQQTAIECHPEMVPSRLPDLGNVNKEHTSTHERPTLTLVEGDHAVYDKFVSIPKPDVLSSAGANTLAADDKFDGRRAPGKESNSRGRNSYVLDSAEGLQTTNSSNGAHEQPPMNNTNSGGITQERSRSFISRLQAPTGTLSSADTFRLVPSSVSILANPSNSSSQCQDRIWEEQAEIYSSGGRGTPGREDDPSAANAMLHSLSTVATAISSEHYQVSSAPNALRKGHIDTNGRHPSTVPGAKERRKKGKKRGRSPRTPLRSLLSDDGHSKALGSGMRSPTGGHFMQQIMSKIRGNSPKAPSPKSPEPAMAKRRNTWSSCICFSIK